MRKLADIFSTMVILAGVALLVIWLTDDADDEVSGAAFVIDGDTVTIGQEKIRLKGIDAPELNQTCHAKGRQFQCGVQARAHLRQLSRSGEMHCNFRQRDKYGRLLGQCFIGEIDINARMVGDGWAVAYGGYYELERQAKKLKNGIWAGDFDRPAVWRKMRSGIVEPSNSGRGNAWWEFWR